MQAVIDGFREHAVVWMILLFVGILYWAFRPRFQRRKRASTEESFHKN